MSDTKLRPTSTMKSEDKSSEQIAIHIWLSFYAPAPCRGIKRWCCLTSVCLTSVAYIGPMSRTERSRKTKISTEIAHVTRDSDSTFKVKKSRSPGRFSHRGVNASAGSCSGERGNVLSVGTYCYVVACRRGRLGGARRFGTYRGAGA